jgi:NAD(P)-dependent dehydrogenase (short-subunit alcohol dehydrogenase family)
VDSPLLQQSIQNIVEKTGRTVEEVRAELEDMSPQHRFFEASEVASMCVFLASDEAKGVNGQAIPIDGGALNV